MFALAKVMHLSSMIMNVYDIQIKKIVLIESHYVIFIWKENSYVECLASDVVF